MYLNLVHITTLCTHPPISFHTSPCLPGNDCEAAMYVDAILFTSSHWDDTVATLLRAAKAPMAL